MEIRGLGPDGKVVVTSDDILNLTEIPTNLLILGGGYIGVEFASIFSALGSKVTLVEQLPDILGEMDAEGVRMINSLLKKSRVEVLTESKLQNLERGENGIQVQILSPNGLIENSYEKMLLATGRRAFIDASFKELGIKIDEKQIIVNSQMETNIANVYAVGDVAGPPLLAHAAMAEAEVAADNIMGKKRFIDHSKIPSCIFTTPEMASVGLTEQMSVQNHEIKIGKFPFRFSSRAILANEIEGFLKVIADANSREILGIHIIGPNAAELIAAASVLINVKATVEDLAEAVQVHPTLGEAFTEAALDVDGMGIHIPKSL